MSEQHTDSLKKPRRKSRPGRQRSAQQAAKRPHLPGRPLPPVRYPEDLPVSACRHEIADAITRHAVVIVCGETGSGKTTQLPKICLDLGRGRNAMIGHTQPRRLAATSVARRIASELDSDIGDWVGYQIRFSARTGPATAIKLMTDGVLLAETQKDPDLRRYDTLIIDEAHERSLNIDFLLGYLKQLLRRRKDLKLIITSATIDAGRFAEFFASANKPAPVIQVSGRLYPVELRYRPIVPEADSTGDASDEERHLESAVVDAVDECMRHGPGDVLVFLPGEREIRECAGALRQHALHGSEVLPLYARLSRAEQEEIFRPQTQARRIVLATNVAETSLTVPGIRFVIDSGLARIKRYSWRSKVEQLQIEAISQASANQRSGRCGRLGPGVCIRLYAEDDFAARAAHTDPEIQRSSLAAVILRMKSLGLQEIEDFPFIDAPARRAITDGYGQLQELGALDDARNLTRTGRHLARLPVDPRIARMIVAAHEHQSLTEILVIAAALSVQDPRDRPMQAREAAAQAHAGFNDERSEFLAWLKLWNWYQGLAKQKLSQRQQSRQMREKYLSPRRMREWRETHQQLLQLVRQQGWRLNQTEASIEQVHLALLAGLLGNIGMRSDDGSVYRGAHDIRFVIHPGSVLRKKAGRWILAGELVRTSRLFARCIAQIQPRWIEQAGAHLLRRFWSEPHWSRRRGQVLANERATVHGLPIYTGRKVNYGRIDPAAAREIFIREALVTGEIDSKLPFIAHNRRLIASIEHLEHKSRRPDILVDEDLIFACLDREIPANVHQTRSLEAWYRTLDRAAADRLKLNREELMRHEASGITTDVFPRQLDWDGIDLAVDYHFEPGSLRDGMTVTVPLYALNQISEERSEWLVPGMLKEKVHQLLRSLPQRLRKHCVPLPDYAAGFHARWFDRALDPPGGLLQALIDDVRDQCRIQLTAEDFRPTALPAHLFMNFRVVDKHGRMLSAGRNLDQLRAELGAAAQKSFQTVARQEKEDVPLLQQEKFTSWTFGRLPELLEIERDGQVLAGFPAVCDRQDHCVLDVFDDPQQARRVHDKGLRRLFRLALREQLRYASKNLPDWMRTCLLYVELGTQQDLADQLIDAAIQRSCMGEPWPQDEEAFRQRCEQARSRIVLLMNELARMAGEILALRAAVLRELPRADAWPDARKDMQRQIDELLGKHFLRDTPAASLQHLPRYLKAMLYRIEKLPEGPDRDARHMADIQRLSQPWRRSLAELKGSPDARLQDFRWQLEELRVSLFAQHLRTPHPVSVKRLQKAWETLRS